MKNILSLFISIGFYLAIWVVIAFLAGLSLFQFDSNASVYPYGVFYIAIFGYIVFPVIRQFLLYRISTKRGFTETGIWLIFIGIIFYSSFGVTQRMLYDECFGYVGAGVTTDAFSGGYCSTHKMPVFMKALEHSFYRGPVSQPYAAEFYFKSQYAINFSDLESQIKSYDEANRYYITSMECYYSYQSAPEAFYLTKYLNFDNPNDAGAICPEHYPVATPANQGPVVYGWITPEQTFKIGAGKFIIKKI